MNIKIIGVAGRSGSGKGFVCSIFRGFGALHLDTDKIYHELLKPKGEGLSPCAEELRLNFGNDIIGDDLVPDRKKLGAVVFSDKEKLLLLNEITHKYIFDETMRLANESDAPFAVMDAPVLFESGFDEYCDFTVCVFADDETCIKRIIERDGVDREKAKARLDSQLSCAELEEKCDFRIINDGTCDVTKQVKNILTETGLQT